MFNCKKIFSVLGGGAVAVLSLWLIGAFFCRNFTPIEYDPAMCRNVFRERITILSSREGYAFTHSGEHGFIAPDSKIRSPRGKVLLFGDSFAEGLHVSDDCKMHRVANRILETSSPSAPYIANAAMSSQLFSDTLWQLPYYLKYYGDDIRGVAVIVMDHDLLPGHASSLYGSVIAGAEGAWHLVPPKPARVSRFGEIKYRYHLNAFLYLGSALTSSWRDWYGRSRRALRGNFSAANTGIPASVVPSNDRPDHAKVSLKKYISWQLAKLREEAGDLPVVLICCTDKPSRGESGIVPAGKDSALLQTIRAVAAEHHIGFYSAREDFNELHENHLPVCGFPNTLPGSGHFSVYAHQRLGEILAAWCKNQFQSGAVK